MWVDDHPGMSRSRPLRRHLRAHSLLAVVPIGCWSVSLVLDLASMTRAATSLIGIGLLGAGAAGVAGLVDGIAVPSRTRSFRLVMMHFGLMATVVILYLAGYVLRVAEPADRSVSLPLVILSAVSAVVTAIAVVIGVVLAHRRI
ncbi:DUF2231 domain-containing protein [Lentzea sp. NPDC005914]|uniref:DUF2231 domain-containing protein n=1 Tax=Lentzea sp. NPDC005914 TaxID=3154572 RepID=UPI0033CFBC32